MLLVAILYKGLALFYGYVIMPNSRILKQNYLNNPTYFPINLFLVPIFGIIS